MANEITMADFSSEAIQKVVVNKTVLSTFSIGPVGIGFILSAGVLILEWIWWLHGVSLGLAVCGIGYGLISYKSKRGDIVSRLLTKKTAFLQQKAAAETRELEADLFGMDEERAAKQVVLLKETFLMLKTKLLEKFGKGDAQYNQYIGPAELVVLKALANLRAVRDRLQHNRSIDLVDARERIEELNRENAPEEDIKAVQRRIDIHAENEEANKATTREVSHAITQLQEITASVINLKVSKEDRAATLKRSMAVLADIAKRQEEISDRAAAHYQVMTGGAEGNMKLRLTGINQ